MLKNLDQTVRLQSKKREEVRGEKLQRIAEGTSSALRLASLSAVFPKINECPGTHCSLIVMEGIKDSFCHICQRV